MSVRYWFPWCDQALLEQKFILNMAAFRPDGHTHYNICLLSFTLVTSCLYCDVTVLPMGGSWPPVLDHITPIRGWDHQCAVIVHTIVSFNACLWKGVFTLMCIGSELIVFTLHMHQLQFTLNVLPVITPP